MSRNWQRSNLRAGEELRISTSLFIGGDSVYERIESITYLGESDTGILVDCTFKPSIRKMKSPHYKLFINWASIWCGHIKVYSGDGSLIVAKRKPGQPIGFEVINQ